MWIMIMNSWFINELVVELDAHNSYISTLLFMDSISLQLELAYGSVSFGSNSWNDCLALLGNLSPCTE